MKINSTNYTLSTDGLILNEGTATADEPYERVFALGKGTVAIATAPSSEAVALGHDTVAEARGFGTRAVAHKEGAHAEAHGEGALALNSQGGTARAFDGATIHVA